MKINKIKLFNYRQYYNDQVISIPENGKIIIIRGENGAGKTNLINGLTWCLYNEKTSIKELINDKALNEAQAGKQVEMYIEIHFKHDDILYLLKRNISVINSLTDQLKTNEKYTLQKIKDGTIQESIDDEITIEHEINNILNESVKSYFFFDGARIETFTKDDHYKDVDNAIKNLLKIETIKRAKEHIGVMIKEITGEIKDDENDGTTENLKSKIRELDENIEHSKNELDTISNDIAAIEKDIENTEKEITSIEQNSIYKENKLENETKRNEKREQLKKCAEEMGEYFKKVYLCFADNLLVDALQVINIEPRAKKINAESVREIIKETLKNNQCYICHEQLTQEKKELILTKLPKITSESSSHQNLIQLSSSFTSAKKEGEKIFHHIVDSKMHINEYEKEIENYDENIAKQESMIIEELPDIKEYKEMFIKLKNKRDEKRDARIFAERKMNDLKDEKKQLEKDFSEIKSLSEFAEKQKKKLQFSYKIRDEIERLYDKYEKTEIAKINEKIKLIFDGIIRKEGVFKNIFIDDEYKLNVFREYSNENILKQLSYGERQILSLSLILALAKVSGDQGPFVMDTPMGNLDPIHRQKLVKSIPHYINQLFLLVTSSEFTKDLYQLCSNDISAIYILNTVSNGMTEIKKET